MSNYTLEYTDNIKEGFGGKCYYPWFPRFGTCRIVILSKYKNDIGLLNHEIKHAEQYSNNFFHGLMTSISKEYRYEIELDAYTEQIKEYNYSDISDVQWIIEALLNKYDLDISSREIRKDLIKILWNINYG